MSQSRWPNDNQCEEAFRKKAAELITIKDIPALSRLSLSHSGQLAGMSNSKYCRTVVNALKNLRGRQLKDVPAENILITCAKDGWHKGGDKTVSPALSLQALSCSKEQTGLPRSLEGPTTTHTAPTSSTSTTST